MKIKFVKIISSTLALMFLLTASSFAQDRDRPSPTERAEKRTQKMVEKLGLNTTQASQVAQINLHYANQIAELKAQPQGEKGAKKEAMKTIRDNYKAQLQNVLTAEQFAQIKEKSKRSKGDKERLSPTERAEKYTQRMVEKLGLNTSQANQVAQINLDNANKIADLKAQPQEEKGAKREAMKTIRDNYKAQLQNILTTEQFAQFEESMTKKKGKRGKGKRRGRG